MRALSSDLHHLPPGLQFNAFHYYRREALRRWKQRYGPRATYGALLKVFLNGQYTRGAQKVTEVIRGQLSQHFAASVYMECVI